MEIQGTEVNGGPVETYGIQDETLTGKNEALTESIGTCPQT